MDYKMLHIFRNTPFGRETFLQTLYFCKTVKAAPVVYIPKSDKFLFYFSNDVIQVDLDSSYLDNPKTTEERARRLLSENGMREIFLTPKNYTASTLPDIPTHFDFLSCPRSVSDKSSRIGLGHIGPKVRRIIKHATFPVFLTSPVFKPWTSIAVLFGGSNNAVNALRLGLKLSLASGLPLDIYTLMEGRDQAYYKGVVEKEPFWEMASPGVRKWHFWEKDQFDDMLYEIPHDALLVLGAYGHGMLKDLLFGSKMEHIQSTLGNNMLVTGPKSEIDLR
ncbi:MAG: universal stress protein [Desulfobacter sp.]|nr:MAG: universal stress protein [Desulfobacter sp.]